MAQRYVTVTYRGVDELTPITNRISGGLTNVGRVSEQSASRMAGMGGMLTHQWERFQRSFSHAIGYAAVYKIYEAYNNLKNFNAELGQLAAMMPNAGNAINDLGTQALRISTITGAPLQDVQESINNIVQSIPNIGDAANRSLIPVMAKIEAMASRVMDVDPRSFGATVLGIARAFPRYSQMIQHGQSEKALTEISSMLFTTRTTTPRVTGSDITQYIPTLIGGARASGFNLPQTLSMFHVAQQIIQRPATTTQYLRQLMLRIQNPTAQAQKYFNQAGLTKEALANMTGPQILTRLAQFGMRLPGGISQERLNRVRSGQDLQNIKLSGQSAEFFRNTVGGRIQSLVAMTALTTNYGELAKQNRRLLENTKSINKAYEQWRSYNSLTLMSNALSNATTDILRNFNPAILPAADALTNFSGLLQSGSDKLRSVDKHIGNMIGGRAGHAVSGALDVGLTTGALYAMFSKYGLRGGIKKIGGMLGRTGIKRLERDSLFGGEERLGARAFGPLNSAFTAEATFAALAGQANGTPSMPFWVVIHPLSQITVPGMFKNSNKTLEQQVEQDVKNLSKKLGGPAAAEAQAIRRLGFRGALIKNGMRLGGASALLAAESPALGDVINILRGKDPFGGKQTPERMRKEHFPSALARFFTVDGENNLIPRPGTPQWMVRALNSTRASGKLFGILPFGGQRDVNQAKANRLIQGILHGQLPNTFLKQGMASQQDLQRLNTYLTHHGISQQQIAAAGGLATIEATLLLEPTQELKNLLKPQKKRAHIPVGSPQSPPQHRGKQKTHKVK